MLRFCYDLYAKMSQTKRKCVIYLTCMTKYKKSVKVFCINYHTFSNLCLCVLPGTRTLDPLIKSQLLYQLS